MISKRKQTLVMSSVIVSSCLLMPLSSFATTDSTNYQPISSIQSINLESHGSTSTSDNLSEGIWIYTVNQASESAGPGGGMPPRGGLMIQCPLI